MDDLGQIIFVVLFILFGLISSSKKKARQKPRAQGATPPADAAPSRPRVQEVSPTEAELPLPTVAPGHADNMVRPERALAEELLVFLQGQAEPANEPVDLPQEIDDEAKSVEETPAPRPYAVTDTPVERPYLVEETTIPLPYATHDSSRQRRKLTRDELRHAFVMKEVLGPPKALE